MNALELLAEQHRQISDRFAQLLDCAPERRSDCFLRLANALTQHSILESTHLYPALQKHGALTEVNDALIAHEEVKYQLENVCRLEGPDGFRSCIESLRDKLADHIKEEETYLFMLARTHLGDRTLEELGQAMRGTMRLWEDYQPEEGDNGATPWLREEAHANA